MRILFTLLLFTSLLLMASEPLPFNLTYPTVTKSSKIEQQQYDKLEVWIDKLGYKNFYGHTWKQEFAYPKFSDDSHQKAVKDFIVKSLKIKPSQISPDNYGHFSIKGKEYWLKLSLSAADYNYVLLRVEKPPKLVTLDANRSYTYEKSYEKRFGKVSFAKNIAIAHVKNSAIKSVTYKKYDEHEFYYNRKYNLHKGKFWSINFTKLTDDENSVRYSIAHSYKEEMLKLGATVLVDADNSILFRLERDGLVNIIECGADSYSFSIVMIQEEPFKQSLVLSPDKIKSELDKTGKITLDGIYFDFNKATLKPESNKAILSTVALMQKYPDLVLSVHGHTDSKGSDSYNMTLSAERAASVRSAIIANGIESSRLHSKGFGETKPIASNESDDGRAKNRRVELHKVSGGDKKSIITIDFIKPLPNSVVDSKNSHKKGSLGIHYTKPYSQKEESKEFNGHLDVISYNIVKDGEIDESVSRKEIIKNYENVLELYSAKIVGKYSNTLYFKIKDRGDGVAIYGAIEGYSASYTIRFLIEEKR